MTTRLSALTSITRPQIEELRGILEDEFGSEFDSPNTSIVCTNIGSGKKTVKATVIMAIRGAALPEELSEAKLNELIGKAIEATPMLDLSPDYAVQSKIVMATSRHRH